MYKRIISIFLALCLSLSCFCVPAFAASDNDAVSSACGQYFSLLSDYLNGQITYEAFKDKTAAIYHDIPDTSDRSTFQTLCDGLTSAAEGVSYAASNATGGFVSVLRDTAKGFDEFFGIMEDAGGGLFDIFNDFWDLFCTDNGFTNTAVDTDGYGAMVYCPDTGGKKYFEWYGDFGVFSYNSKGVLQCTLYNNTKEVSCSYSDTVSVLEYAEGHQVTLNVSNEMAFYGDFRHDDGSSADDLTTPNPTTSIPPEELPSDTDLTDFLKDLINKLKDLFPDTSTIEGLLRAILAKCTSIDEKINNGGGGMNPEDLSLLLDKTIVSLTTQNKVNNDALLQELISIRKILQGYGDEEIPPEEADSILQGLISGITSGLLSFVGIDIDVSEIVDICEEAGDLGISVLRGIVDIIGILNAAVPLQSVNALITTLTGIIFNLNEPTDLTFTLNGTEVTFLPVDLLSVPQVAGALNIIKGLVSIIVAYAWLKWARKFYLSQF